MGTGAFLVPYEFAEEWSVHEWAVRIGLVRRWDKQSWLGRLFRTGRVAHWILPGGMTFTEPQITALFHRAFVIDGFATPAVRYDM